MLGFAMTAAAMALNPPGDIVEITIFSGSLYAVCFFPAVLFGLYWEKGTARSVLWSMLLGTVVLLLWILWGSSKRYMRSSPRYSSPSSPTTG